MNWETSIYINDSNYIKTMNEWIDESMSQDTTRPKQNVGETGVPWAALKIETLQLPLHGRWQLNLNVINDNYWATTFMHVFIFPFQLKHCIQEGK